MKLKRILLIFTAVCAALIIGGCHWLPEILHGLNPAVTYRVPGDAKTLFLTFDDGPSDSTHLILDVLRKHKVHATFFVTTDHIRPDVMRQVIADGHQIANHLKSTKSLARLSDAEFEADFEASENALAAFLPAKIFRPPGGSISSARAHYVTARGYTIVVGTVFPLDHWIENQGLIESVTKLMATDGGIIILHDTASRGPRTAAVLDTLIPYFQKQGYHFALLPQPAGT